MVKKSNIIKLNDHRSKTARPSLAKSFNDSPQQSSDDSHEIELKFLVKNNDYNAFKNIKRYFGNKNMIAHSDHLHLLTRQLDTYDRSLLNAQETLRIRGTCVNNDLSQINYPDICFKTGKTIDKTGAVRRGEFETRIKSFDKINLSALKRAYPKAENPALYKALNHIKTSDLREYFRIDCHRARFLVVLDEKETGIKGKQFVAELVLDHNVFVADIPGIPEPVTFLHDLEIEFENHTKPCEYSDRGHTKTIISSPMTDEEADHARMVMKKHLRAAAGNVLVENHTCKGERGFDAFPALLHALEKFVDLNKAPPKKQRSVTSIFHLNTKKSAPKVREIAREQRRSIPKKHIIALKK